MIALVVALLLLLAGPARADAPYELFHVARARVAGSVLRETIGVLTLSSGTRRGRTLRVYRSPDGSDPGRTIDALDLRPVSSFDYHPSEVPELIGGYRLPITRRVNGFVQVCADAVSGARVWLKLEELSDGFYHDEAYFEELAGFQEYLDPFFGEPDATRFIYEEPDAAAPSREISGGDFENLKVLAQKEGFLQVGRLDGDGAPRPLGWIRVRDRRGRLQVWISNFDDC